MKATIKLALAAVFALGLLATTGNWGGAGREA
jgi:hypothetical protein